ncbi:uncharacterized protein N0V89_004382 [Didymosphaeria variabile]|uniref:Uncharacterized protein n=1 Tax=Didymosphaeria variabile TaxID=1932322 RepID=A0A9W9CD60_9PLEO|nr:uncharacterized protein N0V89_004382 [Didymosphaeria variabile]KAJ4356350.1 hypothetical protein N0V89_004382 [Didymosphaeria variabile]
MRRSFPFPPASTVNFRTARTKKQKKQAPHQPGAGAVQHQNGQPLSKKQRKKLVNEANQQAQSQVQVQVQQQSKQNRRKKKLLAREAEQDKQGEAAELESATVPKWVKDLKPKEFGNGKVVNSHRGLDSQESQGYEPSKDRAWSSASDIHPEIRAEKTSIESISDPYSTSMVTSSAPAPLVLESSDLGAPTLPLVDIVKVAAGTKPFISIMVPLFPSKDEIASVKRNLDTVFGTGWASGTVEKHDTAEK